MLWPRILLMRIACLLVLGLAVLQLTSARGHGAADDLAASLRSVDVLVARPDEREAWQATVREQVARLRQQANAASTAAWRTIRNRADWERFRDEKLAALQRSLGAWPAAPSAPRVHSTRTLAGDGFTIDNLLIESRPGDWISANLYRPHPVRASQPGLLICHSHHTGKTHGELQDMGVTWARAGCLVLVMDQLGHGERRQHPFASASDFPQTFRVGHADYYFRYDCGLQLHLVGESLLGWMAWDLLRGVDVLLAQPGIDRNRVALLGAVAGGGDPAAVAAALDTRIAAAVPFNFGGPQPETRFPLPDDAEDTFNYVGSGSWESTRNLRRSAADGFAPWVIVGSIAPRGLVYAHEFRWDRERDPVWRRLQTIYGFYERPDRLAFTFGSGSVTGQSADDSHCTHIGKTHRVLIHQAFQRWLQIDASPSTEFSARRPSEELVCWTAAARQELQPRPLSALLQELAEERLTQARRRRNQLPDGQQRRRICEELQTLLGSVTPLAVTAEQRDVAIPADVTVERWPDGGLPELWRVAGGVGMSGLAIAGNRVVTLIQDDDQQLVLVLDVATGRRLHTVPLAPAFQNAMGPGPRATPALAGDRAFVLTGEGRLAAVDVAHGQIVWQRDVVQELGGKPAEYGMACSPLVLENRVIVTVGAPRGTVAAYETETGRPAWTVVADGGQDTAGYSSPAIRRVGDDDQLLVFEGRALLGIAPQSGQLLWRYPFATEFDCNIATPLAHRGRVFISAGENHGSALLAVNRKDNAWQVVPVWESPGARSVLRNEWQTSVLLEDHLYGFDNVGSAGPVTHLTCIAAETGARKWQQLRFGKGNLIAADGKLFLTTLQGELVVVRASPEQFEELGRQRVLRTTRQAPALAHGRLYLRDDREIVCLDARRPK